ncbi:hypothetical protein VKT23_014077 [Stygiomarasmius scandens]|uniref:Uncharacterized protein n=1 Tax=Marasmiellus scandens TaxID=2682957 RepID=A0ABR1J182_9AGAR
MSAEKMCKIVVLADHIQCKHGAPPNYKCKHGQTKDACEILDATTPAATPNDIKEVCAELEALEIDSNGDSDGNLEGSPDEVDDQEA